MINYYLNRQAKMDNIAQPGGQVVIEYAMLLFFVIIAVLFMRFYISRSVQGYVNSQTENLGSRYYYGSIITNSITAVSQDIFTNATYNEPADGKRTVIFNTTIYKDDIQENSSTKFKH